MTTLPTPIKYILGFLVLIGCGIYIYGVWSACYCSFPDNCDTRTIDEFLATAVTSIGAVLSTNLGGLIGIAVIQENSKLRKAENWNPLRVVTDPEPTAFQILACYIYILSLLAAAIVWFWLGLEKTEIVPLVPEMTKTLLGVIVGALAVALGIVEEKKRT